MFYSTDVLTDARQYLNDFIAPYRWTDLLLNGWVGDVLKDIYRDRPDCQINPQGNRNVFQPIPITGWFSYSLTGGHDYTTSSFETVTGWDRRNQQTLYFKYEGSPAVVNIYYSTASRTAGTGKQASFPGVLGIQPLTTLTGATVFAGDNLALSGYIEVDTVPTASDTWEVTDALKPMIISEFFRCAMGHFVTSRALLMDSNDTNNLMLSKHHYMTFLAELTGREPTK
jgi:hypothetical protein